MSLSIKDENIFFLEKNANYKQRNLAAFIFISLTLHIGFAYFLSLLKMPEVTTQDNGSAPEVSQKITLVPPTPEQHKQQPIPL
jgi:hypothetical protein